MSQEQEQGAEHAPLIKTSKQLIMTVVLAFLIPILILLMLVNLVTSQNRRGAGSNAFTPAAIAARLAPVAGFELIDANAPKVFKTGEEVFKAVCSSCHTAGVAGAPKLGDRAAWGPRIQAGYATMLQIALQGKGAMPPKGGALTLSDYEIARTVVFMANHSGGSLAEPKPPTTAPSAQATGASPQLPTTPSAAMPPSTTPTPSQSPTKTPSVTMPSSPLPAAPAATPTPSKPTTASSTATTPTLSQPTTTPSTATTSTPSQPAAAPPNEENGKKLYKAVCMTCHATGIAGAPQFGDKNAWAPYIATGEDTMVNNALRGKGAMPPKGGAVTASEEDIRAAVRYMVNAAK